jgi:hypothetical protein
VFASSRAIAKAIAAPYETVTTDERLNMTDRRLQGSNVGSDGAFIDTMPAEMIDAILENLRPHDLAVLARVSKKYRELAQSALWRNIELHGPSEHDGIFGLALRKEVRRCYLDEQLPAQSSYRLASRRDSVSDLHNAVFAKVIGKLYRTARRSPAWVRLAPLVQSLCLTVTNKSPPQIWNMVLSLPNLITIELIGENSIDDQGPPQPKALRRPACNKVQNVRLRGYIPALFVSELCKASAPSITRLDLGILAPPRIFQGDPDEMELQDALGYPLYVAPRGVLWFSPKPTLTFSFLTRVLLCKRGSFDGPLEMSEEEDAETREDEAHDLLEFKQWASILRSVRSTVVQVVLEQRPVYLSYLLYHGMGITPDDKTVFCPEHNHFDSSFYNHVLRAAFDDGQTWPKLKSLTLRGINLSGFEEETGETLQSFQNRALPGIKLQETSGNYMFFSTRTGTIMNQYGTDGLKPQLSYEDDGDFSDDFYDPGYGFGDPLGLLF